MNKAISLKGVEKRYDNFQLQPINLELPEGEIMGLVGANGAGKSTLLRVLTGLIRPDAGEVHVLGMPMPERQIEVKQRIGFASEDMRLYKSQTLRWHMDFLRSGYPNWDESYANTLLKRFDLRAEQKLQGFSHGQRVKALLLLNLARHPQLLLLDEPTTGLDPVARVEVLEALSEVLKDESRSVLFSSHNTHDVEQLSDSITFIHRGKLVASKNKEEFLDQYRRVLCVGEWRDEFNAIPEIIHARRNGSLIELKTNQFGPELQQRLLNHGLQIQSIERMNLEDIFVTTVRHGEVQ
jgi:ABC-2 type transport system ATP-binding protein